MKDDLISRKAALDYLDKRRTYELMDGRNKAYGKGVRDAIKDIEALPSVPAVPLDELARWITENLDPRCDCDYCFHEDPDPDVRECCNCPKMSEEQVKEKLEKWMEEQDGSESMVIQHVKHISQIKSLYGK